MPPAHAGQPLTQPSADRSVCAWCGDAIGSRTLGSDSEQNFGICRKCLEVELTRLKARKPIKRSHAAESVSMPILGIRR
jgi:hypothetical protein